MKKPVKLVPTEAPVVNAKLTPQEIQWNYQSSVKRRRKRKKAAV